MSDFIDKTKVALSRVLRGSGCSNLLSRLGIDPRRYWLLMDLFQKLSKRQEMLGQLGRQQHVLRVSAGIFAVISGIAALVFLLLQGPVFFLAAFTLGIAFFSLMAVLLSEAANSLVNPEEALALAHQPIDGATYSAAKLSHLLQIVLHYVLGWTFFPALVMPFLKDARWFYPILYLLLGLLGGILLGLFCCSLYGVLMRVVPPRRIKSAAQLIQALPAVLFGFFQFSPRGTTSRVYRLATEALAPIAALPVWLLISTGTLLVAGVTVFGLRSLSGDYLIRVSSMVHGRADAGTRVRWSLLGEIVRRLFGGQGGRAGFDYMKRMILRDWQFRRQLLESVPIVFFGTIGLVTAGLLSPFSSGWSSTHFIPHALGFILFMTCLMLPYGTDYKGIWLFLLVSNRGLARFAQGVHASLWLIYIAVPYALLLPLFVWKWGVGQAAIFTVFGVCVSSVYLALGIRSIEGVPFGKHIGPTKAGGGKAFVRILTFMAGASLSVAVQYLLFRSAVAVAIATVVLAAAALLMTRKGVRDLHVAMVYHLSVVSQTSTMIYKEVGSETME